MAILFSTLLAVCLLFSSVYSLSNCVKEDAFLSVPELITKYGYNVEIHPVTTDDGYILTLHRMTKEYDSEEDVQKKPVALLVHGLMSSSADWVVMGPGDGLGYILADEGYDVWLGNTRGNYYSRKHLTLNPDKDKTFWDFSFHEIGVYDLPAITDYVLNHTGKEKLHYVGHSQGTTAFFVMTSTKPEYNDKILTIQALAPVAFMGKVPDEFLRFLAPLVRPLMALTDILGLYELVPHSPLFAWAGLIACHGQETFAGDLCQKLLYFISGKDAKLINETMVPVLLGHVPAGASNKQFAHYAQGINSNNFQYYDYGRLLNFLMYGSTSPPHYDLSKITIHVDLYYSKNDKRADVEDVERLFGELKKADKYLVPEETFTHVDFLWASGVKTILYDRVIESMNTANYKALVQSKELKICKTIL